MGLLSKPYKISFRLMGSYLSQLYTNPVRTKSISSCIIAGLGNYVSQRMSGVKLINYDTFRAFVIFGLLFGGSIPHFFFETLSNFLFQNSSPSLLQLLLIERLVFMPAYTLFTLYMLPRLEGEGHAHALLSVLEQFPAVCEANFKYLSLLQYINIFFVPPVLRVLLSNLIDFFWVIYLSHKRQSLK